MKIKLNGKRLYLIDSVNYLRVKIDSKFNRKSHANAIAKIKPSKCHALQIQRFHQFKYS